MTKIRDSFNNKKVLIPYFTYGDPTPEISERIICNAFDQGADMIEIGLPFSDPIADGPVIQESHQRALNHNRNINIDEALTMVKRIKTKYNKPLIFMT
ncbi:MAG: tryptophan synthase subunit alpha, partial [bacterium]|nr:tryptophan synthase subunit alpha [bacterium]